MPDNFKRLASGLESPPSHAYSVVPSDGADLAMATRALNVTTSGNVRLTTVGGGIVTLYVVAGIAFPIRARRIWSTGTTATGIVGMY